MTERTEGAQTTRYYYDDKANIIAEGTVSGGIVSHKASYIRGNQLEVRVAASGSKSYYILNGHGNVVELAEGSGQTLNSYSYDIWGAPVTTNELIAQPFRYSGELWDTSTGLQYLRARWYDPSVGRFMNENTYEGELEDPLSLNLYTYVKNNPLRYWDPTGHQLDEKGSSVAGFGGYAGRPISVKRGTTPNRIAIQPRTVFDLPEEEVLLLRSQAQRGGAGKGTGNAANGARTAEQAGISANDAKRIQNAANRTGARNKCCRK